MKRVLAFIMMLPMIISFFGCQDSSDLISDNDTIIGNNTIETSEVSNDLYVHFIDVGQADSALIICGDKAMLIDGGNKADSSLIYSYLKKQNITKLDYVIATHPHEDHIGGLPAVLVNFDIEDVFSPTLQADSDVYNTFIKKLNDKGLKLQEPKPGSRLWLNDAELIFYGPIAKSDDTNNNSIVLKIVHGENSFLFTGDAEREEEQDILNADYDLSATVLKAGHHGSSSSTTYPFLREVMPKYAVISVGKDNSYGHPDRDTLSRLRDADAEVYRTDMQGDVIAVSDGKTISFTTAKNADIQTNPTKQEDESAEGYIGNIRSKKFHIPSCHTLPAEKNQVYIKTREEAIDSGYSPCGNCIGN